jgi:imidazolonepropionase-like amidohydrolase
VVTARHIEADSKMSHRTAIRAGVGPVCGTDAGTPFNPHGSAPQEIVFMVEWGMAPLDALRAATVNGAELLRLHDVGTIEAGKRADLLLVEGDPVDDPPALLGRRSVWRAGVPV